MTLGQKQKKFMQMLPRLIDYIYEQGYACTMGDGYRDPRVFGMMGDKKGYGRGYSNHKIRLAIDLNLFKKVSGRWEYCTDTEDHRPFGEFWESLGGSWGGRFNDGNHYSLQHKGRR